MSNENPKDAEVRKAAERNAWLYGYCIRCKTRLLDNAEDSFCSLHCAMKYKAGDLGPIEPEWDDE